MKANVTPIGEGINCGDNSDDRNEAQNTAHVGGEGFLYGGDFIHSNYFGKFRSVAAFVECNEVEFVDG